MSRDQLPLPPERIPPRGDRPPTVATPRRGPMVARFVGGIAAVFLVGYLSALEMRPLTLPAAEPERMAEPTETAPAIGDACERSRVLLEAAIEAPFASREIARLPEVLPAGIGLPVRAVEQTLVADAGSFTRRPGWEAELVGSGFVRGVVRAWDLGHRTVASVSVYEFETGPGAFAFERFAVLEHSCRRSVEVFTVGGVEGGTGLRMRWADGTESEQVTFVRGARRYHAQIRGPDLRDRSVVVSIARALDRTAG